MTDTPHRAGKPTYAGLGLIALSSFLPNVEACNRDVIPVAAVAKEITYDPATALSFGAHFGAMLLLVSLLVSQLGARRSRSPVASVPMVLGAAYAIMTNVYLAAMFLAELDVFAVGPVASTIGAAHAMWPYGRGVDRPWRERLFRAFSFATAGPSVLIVMLGPRYGGVVFIAGSVLLLFSALRGPPREVAGI